MGAAGSSNNNVIDPQSYVSGGNGSPTATMVARQLTAQPQPAAQREHGARAGAWLQGTMPQGSDEQHQPMQQCGQLPQRDGVQVSQHRPVCTHIHSGVRIAGAAIAAPRMQGGYSSRH